MIGRICGVGALCGLMVACAATPTRRDVGEVWRDQRIKTTLHWKLQRDKAVTSPHIDADVFRGVVTLRGQAATTTEVARAEALARQTKGVVLVENHLVIDGGTANGGRPVPATLSRPAVAARQSEPPMDLAPEPPTVTQRVKTTASPATPATTVARPTPATKSVITDRPKTANRYMEAGTLPPSSQVAKPTVEPIPTVNEAAKIPPNPPFAKGGTAPTKPSPQWLQPSPAAMTGASPAQPIAPVTRATPPQKAKATATRTLTPVAPPKPVAPTPDELAREAAMELKKLKSSPTE